MDGMGSREQRKVGINFNIINNIMAILAMFYTMQKGDANIVGHQSQ